MALGIPAAPILWVLLGVATWWDIRQRRIPNGLIALGLLFGCGLALQGGSLPSTLLGTCTALGILLLPFARGTIGGGDVKLAMVVGAFTGPKAVLSILLLAALLTGVIAGCFWFTLRFRATDKAPTIPLALPLSIATIALGSGLL